MDKVQRHWRWLREDGLSAYLEEHDLNPLVRVPRDLRKIAWERTNGARGGAVPLFIVGVQRSGTNMLTHGLEMAPDVRVYNEGDRRAFHDFRLRPLPQIDRLIARHRSRLIVFKPLCDSHRIDQILRDVSSTERPRALWVWRNVEGRVRSALAKFATSNLDVLRAWASGNAGDHWQMQGLSDDSRAFLSSLDHTRTSPGTAAAAFWYVRNRLFFELGLDRRADAMSVGYDLFMRDPEQWMRAITTFCGIDYRPELVAHVNPSLSSRHRRDELDIDGHVLDRCHELTDRLLQATTAAH
jgi:hypothetical protein